MGRLSQIFAESNAQGGSESMTLEERILKVEEMLANLTSALIGSTEETTEETVTETEEITEREDEDNEL